MKLIVLAMLAPLLFAAGCFSPRPGLERTQFQKWERKQIPEAGLSFEVPRKSGWAGPQVGGWYREDDHPKIVLIDMHYRHPSSWGESWPLIRLTIYRFTARRFDAYERGLAGRMRVEEYFNAGSLSKFSTDLRVERIAYPRFENSEYLCFRKDYKAPNGDVILAGAEILPGLLKPSYPAAYQAEDRQAVERILNSIQVR
jgi:hypothetical protein